MHYNMRANDLPTLNKWPNGANSTIRKTQTTMEESESVAQILPHILWTDDRKWQQRATKYRSHLIATQEMQVEENTTASWP